MGPFCVGNFQLSLSFGLVIFTELWFFDLLPRRHELIGGKENPYDFQGVHCLYPHLLTSFEASDAWNCGRRGGSVSISLLLGFFHCHCLLSLITICPTFQLSKKYIIVIFSSLLVFLCLHCYFNFSGLSGEINRVCECLLCLKES